VACDRENIALDIRTGKTLRRLQRDIRINQLDRLSVDATNRINLVVDQTTDDGSCTSLIDDSVTILKAMRSGKLDGVAIEIDKRSLRRIDIVRSDDDAQA